MKPPTRKESSVKSLKNTYYDGILESLGEEDFKQEIDFIGSEPVRIKTTNAQQIYNFYQIFPQVLICDMRDSSHFNNCHLNCSINLPVNKIKGDDLINFDPKKIMESLKTKEDKDRFKKRKRSLVVIVAHRTCTTDIFKYLPDLFDTEKALDLRHKFNSQDILATRNSVLLYKALK